MVDAILLSLFVGESVKWESVFIITSCVDGDDGSEDVVDRMFSISSNSSLASSEFEFRTCTSDIDGTRM